VGRLKAAMMKGIKTNDPTVVTREISKDSQRSAGVNLWWIPTAVERIVAFVLSNVASSVPSSVPSSAGGGAGRSSRRLQGSLAVMM